MTIHEKTYREFFGLDAIDPIYSELSGQICNQIHHIFNKKMGGHKTFDHNGKNYPIECIENYIALTLVEHTKAHENRYTKQELWDIHQQTMNAK